MNRRKLLNVVMLCVLLASMITACQPGLSTDLQLGSHEQNSAEQARVDSSTSQALQSSNEDNSISQRDHHTRARVALTALVEEGYQDVVTYFDQADGTIVVEMFLGEEQPLSTSELREIIQETVSKNAESEALYGRASVVLLEDIKLVIVPNDPEFQLLPDS